MALLEVALLMGAITSYYVVGDASMYAIRRCRYIWNQTAIKRLTPTIQTVICPRTNRLQLNFCLKADKEIREQSDIWGSHCWKKIPVKKFISIVSTNEALQFNQDYMGVISENNFTNLYNYNGKRRIEQMIHKCIELDLKTICSYEFEEEYSIFDSSKTCVARKSEEVEWTPLLKELLVTNTKNY